MDVLYRSRDVAIAEITDFRVDVRMGSLARTLGLVGLVSAVGVGGTAWLLLHLGRTLPPLHLLIGIPAGLLVVAVWLCPSTRVLAERMTREVIVEHRHFLVLKSGFSIGFDQIGGVVLMKDPNGLEVGGLERRVWGVALRAKNGGMLRMFFCADEEKVRKISASLVRVTGTQVIEWDSSLGCAVDEARSDRFRRKRALLLDGALEATNGGSEAGPVEGTGRNRWARDVDAATKAAAPATDANPPREE